MAHPLRYSNASKEALEKSPDREPRNIYPTPQYVADAFTNFVLSDWDTNSVDNYIKMIDPGSGAGVFGTSLIKWQQQVHPTIGSGIYGFDIRDCDETGSLPHYDAVMQTDIFDPNSIWWLHDATSVVLGNPPYHKNWRKMVAWIARTVTTYDYVGLLMPTDWRHGLNRKEDVFDIRMPKYVLDSSLRIDFTGNDAQTRNFAFWWWSKGWEEKYYMGVPFNYREWQIPEVLCHRCGEPDNEGIINYPSDLPVCGKCMYEENGNPYGR